MRLRTPRLGPVSDAEAEPETLELFQKVRRGDHVPLIYRTLGHHPKLLKRWMVFGGHIASRSSLPPRDREILMLRIGWLCQAEYEWSEHVRIGRAVGLSDEDIQRIIDGPDASGWEPFEAALMRAADELRGDAFISDSTWKILSERYDGKQLLDVVFTVGQYNLVSMALNSCGVQLEEGAVGFPKP